MYEHIKTVQTRFAHQKRQIQIRMISVKEKAKQLSELRLQYAAYITRINAIRPSVIMKPTELKTLHNSGFFSCCSVKLHLIVDFMNTNKKVPDIVDSSQQFEWYKNDTNKDKDITFDYFEHYNRIDVPIMHPINYQHEYQFINYNDVDYERITPLIKKYFSPSVEIKGIIKHIEQKYSLRYEDICVLYYRGNDKNTEIQKCSYEEYIQYANQILEKNPNIVFLIQSDETEFIECMTNLYPNSFYFNDEIRHMKKCDSTVDIKMKSQNYEFSKKYLAITIIMSKCKYIICGSGNCDIWIMLYRGNNNNVIQHLKERWYNNAL